MAAEAQDDTLGEIEILLDSLLLEAKQTNEHLSWFRTVVLVISVLWLLSIAAAVVTSM